MKTERFQIITDRLIEKIFLWAIPNWIQPNWLSFLRIATVPPIGWLLYNGRTKTALFLFIISASTDFLDGAMARRRNQITDLGKVIDPIADKMLIATILIYMGFEYFMVKIFLVFIALEIISVIFGSVLAYKFGRPMGANIFGKIKMILQSLSVVVFLLGITSKNRLLISGAELVLAVALFFAFLAGIEVYRKKRKIVKKHLANFVKSI